MRVTDRRTDGRTDRILITIPRLHYMQRGKKHTFMVQIPFKTIVSNFFTVLHALQTRNSDEKAVCLSVRLSVRSVDCDKTEERSVKIFIPYERSVF